MFRLIIVAVARRLANTIKITVRYCCYEKNNTRGFWGGKKKRIKREAVALKKKKSVIGGERFSVVAASFGSAGRWAAAVESAAIITQRTGDCIAPARPPGAKDARRARVVKSIVVCSPLREHVETRKVGVGPA